MINEKNYTEYIDRFMAAETTLAEERELYEWFARPGLPAEAEQWRPMFGWYDSITTQTPATATPPAARPVRLLPLRPWQWSAVAAILALIFSLGIWVRHTPAIDPADYLAYEGCYIVRDGKKITDPSVVIPEIKRTEAELNKTLAKLSADDLRIDETLNHMLDAEAIEADPSVQALLEQTTVF